MFDHASRITYQDKTGQYQDKLVTAVPYAISIERTYP
jgi:hypothetical protein